MAIEDIFRALEEQADAECQSVLDNAKSQADAIMAEAREEADGIRQRRLERAEAAVRSKTMQMVNAAKLENRRKTAAIKEQAIGDVFDAAAERLAKYRDASGYQQTFKGLLEEALVGVDGDVEVEVDARDREMAEAVLKEAGVPFSVIETQSAGGVAVVAGGGRIYRRNTFSDRLAKVRQRSQATVSEILFS